MTQEHPPFKCSSGNVAYCRLIDDGVRKAVLMFTFDREPTTEDNSEVLAHVDQLCARGGISRPGHDHVHHTRTVREAQEIVMMHLADEGSIQ